ncbi:MAG: 23S rRNA (uracil(1939)-C(5))-methyltransferase RlmD [Bacteroidales bacterium]
MGRKKKLPVLESVTIVDIGSEGNAIARVDNMVVFVPMLVPGDIADIRLLRKRKNYAEGIPERIIKYSDLRIKPACRHFGTCGGCKWQHLPYIEQLSFKEKQVRDNLERIGKTEIPSVSPIMGSPEQFGYRNKLEYTFSNRRWLTREEIGSGDSIEDANALGFHIPGLFDKVLNIEECLLQPEPTNRIRNAVRQFVDKEGFAYYDFREQKGFMRNLIVRNTTSGELMVIVVFGYEDKEARTRLLDFIRDSFPAITSLMYVINTKRNDTINDLDVLLHSGIDHMTGRMEDLRFRIDPKSFYQTNSNQALELYRVVRDYAGLSGSEVVYDLYSGTGTIALFVARLASRVIGLEFVPEAVEDARHNADMNGIGNALFFAGDIRLLLGKEFTGLHGSPDVIITDPPRAGMHEDVVKAIIEAGPAKIVYVSCNPATQARDISLLADSYKVTKVQPVDMFPHTHHVENIVLLVRRGVI